MLLSKSEQSSLSQIMFINQAFLPRFLELIEDVTEHVERGNLQTHGGYIARPVEGVEY